MKKLLLFIFPVLLFLNASGQKKLSIDQVISVKLRNSGTIIQDNQVKGYFLFYITDKIDRKTNQYNVQILDQNLNKVKDILFEDSKGVTLMEASYNGNTIGMLFRNDDKKIVEMKIYNAQGNLKNTYSRQYSEKTGNWLRMIQTFDKDGGTNNTLFDVGEKGYVAVIPTIEGDEHSYEVDFYSAQQKKQWTYVPEKNEKNKYRGAVFMGFTDSMMLLMENQQKTIMTNKPQGHFVGVNLFTQKKVFDIDNEKEDKPFYATNILTVKGKNNLLVVGTYYYKGANITKDMSTGMVIYTLDRKGKVLDKTYNSWKEDMANLAGSEMKDKKGNLNNLIIHKIQQVDEKIFIVGEAYNQQTIADLVLLELDNSNKLIKMTTFPKTANKWQAMAPGYMSLERSAAYAKATGDFDYQYTTNDNEGSFTILYTDYFHHLGNKKTYTTLRYTRAKFSTNKMDINSKANEIWVYPGVPGSIMIMEYFKKEKRLDMRIEKIS